ncbi:MAG: hypothetical protein KDI17_12160 [Halioglobus sp.]|nr:hypothetical protein [Halioglobus sp.]
MNENNNAPLIHIGYPKTASTWLQRRLFKPAFGFVRALNHVEIQLAINAPTPFQYDAGSVRAWYEKNLAGERGVTPVISSETLSGNIYCGGFNARQNADRLYETFPEGKVLIVTREQKSLIRSLYSTLIEWGMPHSLDRLLTPLDVSNRFPEFNLDYLRFELIAGYYKKLFGDGNVLVIPYELLSSDPQAFAEEIVAFSGASTDLEKLWQRRRTRKAANTSVPISRTLCQRWFNYFFISSALNYSGMFSSSFGKGIYKVRRRLDFVRLPDSINEILERRFSARVYAMTNGKFARSNGALQEMCKFDLAALGYEMPESHPSQALVARRGGT